MDIVTSIHYTNSVYVAQTHTLTILDNVRNSIFIYHSILPGEYTSVCGKRQNQTNRNVLTPGIIHIERERGRRFTPQPNTLTPIDLVHCSRRTIKSARPDYILIWCLWMLWSGVVPGGHKSETWNSYTFRVDDVFSHHQPQSIRSTKTPTVDLIYRRLHFGCPNSSFLWEMQSNVEGQA